MIEVFKREARAVDLDTYCIFAPKYGYAEVVEWSDGGGYDITISTSTIKHISVTIGEFKAIQDLINFEHNE